MEREAKHQGESGQPALFLFVADSEPIEDKGRSSSLLYYSTTAENQKGKKKKLYAPTNDVMTASNAASPRHRQFHHRVNREKLRSFFPTIKIKERKACVIWIIMMVSKEDDDEYWHLVNSAMTDVHLITRQSRSLSDHHSSFSFQRAATFVQQRRLIAHSIPSFSINTTRWIISLSKKKNPKLNRRHCLR